VAQGAAGQALPETEIMTYLEAFKQAMREFGHADEEIERRLKKVGMLVPMPVPPNTVIPQQDERTVIEGIKLAARSWTTFEKTQPAAAEARINEILQRLRKVN
jgi:hypothetical protein